MGITSITLQTCDCLKLKYKGNGYLEDAKINEAIESYNRALELRVPSQEGVILFMRAAAHAALAASQRLILQEMVKDLGEMVPTRPTLRTMYALAARESSLTTALLRRILNDSKTQEQQMRRIQYWHGLYQHALMKALEDALGATELLPAYAPAWERAGSILSDLWRLEESVEFYQRAMELDPLLLLEDTLDQVRVRQKLIVDAALIASSEDKLRLGLDVKG